MKIYADSNGSYDVKEAIRIGKILEEYNYDFYELNYRLWLIRLHIIIMAFSYNASTERISPAHPTEMHMNY